MKGKKLFSLVVGLAVFSLVLAACGSSSSGGGNFPVGKFVSTSDSHVGYYFNEDKTWSYFTYGEVGAQGKYSVKGNQWIEKGTEECPFPGTYEWSFDGTNLTFKLVGEDKCDPRREATDRQTFTLVK
jgi:hypothetical protein